MNPKIMIVDDDPKALRSLTIILRTKGYSSPTTIEDPRNVISKIVEDRPDIILLDMHMPRFSGVSLLKKIKQDHPEIIVIMITGDAQIELAVKCTKLGAHDYFVKPIDTSRLCHVMKEAIENKRLNNDLFSIQKHLLSNKQPLHDAFSSIITQSDNMKQLFKYIEAISKSTRGVLIIGETGTGKELFAKSVHDAADTKGEFVPVNVAGLDETAFSDSIFGHKKGAFTGATSDRKGFFNKAHNGSLFLDEIGDLSLQSQIKLLRVLQENNYYPLGSDKLEVNTARIITATNQNIENLIIDGSFRADLYHRLHIHTVNIPPLRDRREDIRPLSEYFINKACDELKRDKLTIPEKFYSLCDNYSFPGNVRELEIILYDAVIQSDSSLKVDYIKQYLNSASKQNSLDKPHGYDFSSSNNLPTLKKATESLITEALKRTDYNQRKASEILGISRQALHKRISRNKSDL